LIACFKGAIIVTKFFNKFYKTLKNMTHIAIPLMQILHKLGKDINEARRRRRITIELMAQRAGLSRSTIGKIEKGDAATSIGGYASVLFVLGMEKRISELVDSAHDIIGRQLEDERLPQRIRKPYNLKIKKNYSE
jgi:DNA-binding XRE family transcriptional regulator